MLTLLLVPAYAPNVCERLHASQQGLMALMAMHLPQDLVSIHISVIAGVAVFAARPDCHSIKPLSKLALLQT